MKSIKATYLGLVLAGALALTALTASADTNDIWLTTKAKITLLTTEGLAVRGVNVDTVNGTVTLHGKVKTESEREKAAAVVRTVEGVKALNNLIQVVPDEFKRSVRASDAMVKDRVRAALAADKSVQGISVASVNNGVVLLSGKAPTLNEKLRAIELAWSVDGVSRVASEIEIAGN